MDHVEALHTAARMYGGHVRPVDQSLPDAEARNEIVITIGAFVELFTPRSFLSLEDARERLARLAETDIPQEVARSEQGFYWKWGMEGVWRDEWPPETLQEVLTDFADFVRSIPAEELARFPFDPLPLERTLTTAETVAVFEGLRARFGISEFYWYPLDRAETDEPPGHAIAMHAEPFQKGDVQELLRLALSRIGVSRVLEIREAPERDRELALELLEPEGSEVIWTDGTFGWVVYASHESSVTIAGEALLPAFQAACPRWIDWTSWREFW